MPASDPSAPPLSVRGRSAEADRSHVSSGHEGLAAVLEANLPHALEDSTWRLAAAARVRTLRAGETAFDQGESIPLVVVLEGYGAFRRTTVDGRHVIVGIAHAGGLHGIGAAAETPAAATLIALTPAVVATWPGGVLRPILARDPGLALDLIDLVVGRANRLTEAIEELLYSGARDRVLRVLARNRELFFGNPPLVSRTFLPSAVGISREMTGRVIRTLEREGLIARVGARGLTILAPDRFDLAASD